MSYDDDHAEAIALGREAVALAKMWQECAEKCWDEIQRLRRALSSDALMEIAAERRRQVEAEGWTAEHDDEHCGGEMLSAARCYLAGRPDDWPWEPKWWKPTTPRRNAVKAGALALAEKSRLKRARAADDEICEAEHILDLALAAIERINTA